MNNYRDLESWIAKNIFHNKYDPISEGNVGERYPRYTTDMNAALLIMSALNMCLEYAGDEDEEAWLVGVNIETMDFYDVKAPLAICLRAYELETGKEWE